MYTSVNIRHPEVDVLWLQCKRSCFFSRRSPVLFVVVLISENIIFTDILNIAMICLILKRDTFYVSFHGDQFKTHNDHNLWSMATIFTQRCEL